MESRFLEKIWATESQDLHSSVSSMREARSLTGQQPPLSKLCQVGSATHLPPMWEAMGHCSDLRQLWSLLAAIFREYKDAPHARSAPQANSARQANSAQQAKTAQAGSTHQPKQERGSYDQVAAESLRHYSLRNVLHQQMQTIIELIDQFH